MTATAQDPTDELFDSTNYQIPFPKADGHEVTDLVLRIAGTLKLNRHDPNHVKLIEDLNLGRYTTLTVTASVDGKAQTIRHDTNDQEIVTHTVGLKLHSAEVAP
jgi:hypothetical protein